MARGPGVAAARGLGKKPGKVAAALILNGLCLRVRESPVGFFLGKDFLKVGIGDGVLYRKDDRVARFGDTRTVEVKNRGQNLFLGGGIVRDKVARGLGVYRRGRKAQDFEQVGKVGVRNALCGVVVLGGVTGACNIQ